MLYSTMDSTSSFRDLCHCRVMIYAMSGHAENLPVKRRISIWVGGRRCDARPLRLIAASAQGCAQGEQPQGDRVERGAFHQAPKYTWPAFLSVFFCRFVWHHCLLGTRHAAFLRTGATHQAACPLCAD